MQCHVAEELVVGALPDGGAPDASSLADEYIAARYAVLCGVGVFNVHRLDLVKREAVPPHIGVGQIGLLIDAVPFRRDELLAELSVEELSHWNQFEARLAEDIGAHRRACDGRRSSD